MRQVWRWARREPVRRKSRQRQLVFEIVGKSKAHLTAQEVFERARRRLPAISMGTVYRNLRRLAEEGLLRENKMGNRPAHFEVFQKRHYHIWCIQCGRLEDLTLPYQAFLDRGVERLVNYRLREHRLEFYGVCPRCSAEPSGSRKPLPGPSKRPRRGFPRNRNP